MGVQGIAFDLDGTLFDHAAATCGLNPHSAGFEVALLKALSPDPQLRRLLARLRQAARLVLVTNGGASRQRAKLERLDLSDAFDAIVVSGEHGAPKPHRSIFVAAAEALGLALEHMAMVGDDPHRDIAPAQRLGMQGYWVSRGRSWPLERPPDRVARDVFGFWDPSC